MKSLERKTKQEKPFYKIIWKDLSLRNGLTNHAIRCESHPDNHIYAQEIEMRAMGLLIYNLITWGTPIVYFITKYSQ